MAAVTIIMNTNGCYPEYLEAAIYSVLQQTYKDYTLLINCGHPFSNVRLKENFPNVRIINRGYENFVQQMAASFKHINTPYWCVVDSDDYIMPDHLENLMKFRLNPDFDKYNCVGYQTIMKTVKEKPQKLIRAGWVRFLYNWIDSDLIQNLAGKYKRSYGFDQAVDQMSTWNRGFIPLSIGPTYMYRRKEVGHVSTLSGRTALRDHPGLEKRIRLIDPKPIRDDIRIFKEAVYNLPIGKLTDEQTKK